MTYPDFSYEIPHWNDDKYVIGIDEVGRGAFAGPMYIGAVVFPNKMQDNLLNEIMQNKINDSKLLSNKRRETLAEFIKKTALLSHIISIPVEDINKIGIGKAGRIGMEHISRRVIAKLGHLASHHILTDAFEINRDEFPSQTPIVRGDSLSISIAAASIIAKVARDRHMTELSISFPEYGWDRNKGYGTAHHRKAIRASGPTIHHRTDFIRSSI